MPYFDAIAIIYIGALRGAGDTLWPMAATIASSWLIILGGGTLLALAFPGRAAGPWIAASIYVFALGILMFWRFESGAWRKIDLLTRRRRRVPPPIPLDVPVPDEPGDPARP